MNCPYCPGIMMEEERYDYHHLLARTGASVAPFNTMLSVLYKCPECATIVEVTTPVRVIPSKKEVYHA